MDQSPYPAKEFVVSIEFRLLEQIQGMVRVEKAIFSTKFAVCRGRHVTRKHSNRGRQKCCRSKVNDLLSLH